MTNKRYCMSSYLAFRYIEREDMDFYRNTRHHNFVPLPLEQRTRVATAEEIDRELTKTFERIGAEKLGLMLSGGMDSASLASYMHGFDAYTFRFEGALFQDEVKRAEYYADTYGLNLHYIDIDWSTVERYLSPVMRAKGAPVHSIEPMLYQAAVQAGKDGIERLIVGESADLIFGGMDQLLSRDWTVEEFQQRYTFTKPELILNDPEDMSYLFERYRLENGKIDFLHFMDDVFSIESSGSYENAFGAAQMPYTDPYANLVMADELDLKRVRSGEPKYLIRDLFKMKYPAYPVPDKVPMPRPVDLWFEKWSGPQRKEFRKDINMDLLTGNQKWQLYCLEQFLEMYEPEERRHNESYE